jgi:hypothetical protein
MGSTPADKSVGGRSPMLVADQQMRQPALTKAIVQKPKSHRMGPRDSNHWMPKTMSKEASART